MSVNVLVPSGAGSPGFAGILECLREMPGIRVFVGDTNPNAYGFQLADGHFINVRPEDPEYIHSVIRHSEMFGCSVVLPITTMELMPLSEHAELLQNHGLHMAITNFEQMKIANHKAALYMHLVRQYLPCPDFALVKDKATFFKKLDLLGFPNRDLVMKPANSNGSRGFRIITNAAALKSHYFNTKAGSLFTSIEALNAEMPDEFPDDILVCEYLPGIEYSADMLVNHGDIISLSLRSRDKTVSGISVSGTYLRDDAIEEICHCVAKDLKLHGVIGMQFKRSTHGYAKFLEINPRLQGAVSTARLFGINYPLLAVELALGRIPANVPEIQPGSRFNRYWKDISI